MASAISHSLLGILSICPMSGYDIEKFVATNMSYFWKESYGRIYPMLKSMAKLKLVEVRVEHTKGKADRRVYSLTAAGEAEMRRWLQAPTADPSPRNELLLKLLFSNAANVENMQQQVTEFAARHHAALKKYAEIEKTLQRTEANNPGLPFWLMTVDYGRRNSQSLLEWSESTLQKLGSLEKKQKRAKSK